MSDEIQQAAEWFLKFRSGEIDRRATAAFDRWLRSSPQCMKAYLEVSALWEVGADADASTQWPADALIDEAIGERAEVVFLRTSPAAIGEAVAQPVPRHRLTRLARAATVAVAAVLTIAAVAFALQWQSLTYKTAVGEQRFVMLSDGSGLELNSDSEVRVRYTQDLRVIDLLRGEALFSDSFDARRPFVVYVGKTKIRAIGTAFDIYKGDSATSISVLQGAVAVTTGETAPQSGVHAGLRQSYAIVASGKSISVTPTGNTRLTSCDTNAVTAWMRGELILNSASLADAAGQFNRYDARQMVIGPGLEEIRVSGVFFVADPASFVTFLQRRLGLRAIATSSQIMLLGGEGQKNNN